MNIAIVGLAFTHPYTYTKILQRMGHNITHVWDDEPDRLQKYVAQFNVNPVPAPDAIPADRIDGVITTGRFPERVEHALHFIEQGVPVYSSKPMACSMTQVDELVDAVRRTGTPFLSTSVLRFAPALRTLRGHLEEGRLGTLVSVHAASAHDVSMYMREPNVWQDDPQRGGGTIITMGVHALEMLVVLAGPRIRSVWCRAGRRVHTESLSEDVALFTLEWEDGLLGTADVPSGVMNAEYYGVEVFGSKASVKCSIPKADVQDLLGAAVGDVDMLYEFGYIGTMSAFIEMCRTRTMPVSLEESAAIARVLLAARKSSATGELIGMDAFAKGES